MRIHLTSAAAIAALLAAPAVAHDHGEAAEEEAVLEAPSGSYALDKGHASILWTVSHLGLSDYTARFTDFDMSLELDGENPANSSVTATINPLSVRTDYPGDYKAGHADSPYETWDEDIARNARWLNADEFGEITFASTGVEVTGPNRADVTGDLTFRGVTLPVTLKTKLNGVLNPHPFGASPAIGFTAKTTINRSDFGSDAFVPNIGDAVDIVIQAEFGLQTEE